MDRSGRGFNPRPAPNEELIFFPCPIRYNSARIPPARSPQQLHFPPPTKPPMTRAARFLLLLALCAALAALAQLARAQTFADGCTPADFPADSVTAVEIEACHDQGWDVKSIGPFCYCDVWTKPDGFASCGGGFNGCRFDGDSNIYCSYHFGPALQHLPKESETPVNDENTCFVSHCPEGMQPDGFNMDGETECAEPGSKPDPDPTFPAGCDPDTRESQGLTIYANQLRACAAKGWDVRRDSAGFCYCDVNVLHGQAVNNQQCGSQFSMEQCELSEIGPGIADAASFHCITHFGVSLQYLPDKTEQNADSCFVSFCPDGMEPSGVNMNGETECVDPNACPEGQFRRNSGECEQAAIPSICAPANNPIDAVWIQACHDKGWDVVNPAGSQCFCDVGIQYQDKPADRFSCSVIEDVAPQDSECGTHFGVSLEFLPTISAANATVNFVSHCQGGLEPVAANTHGFAECVDACAAGLVRLSDLSCGCAGGMVLNNGVCECPSGRPLQGDGSCGCPSWLVASGGECVCADASLFAGSDSCLTRSECNSGGGFTTGSGDCVSAAEKCEQSAGWIHKEEENGCESESGSSAMWDVSSGALHTLCYYENAPLGFSLCADVFGLNLDFPGRSGNEEYVFNCDPDDERGLVPSLANTIAAEECLCANEFNRRMGADASGNGGYCYPEYPKDRKLQYEEASDLDWCEYFRGNAETASEKICSEVDEKDTFCLLHGPDLDCRGLLRHVWRCNDLDRVALDPFLCGRECPEGKDARGGNCE